MLTLQKSWARPRLPIIARESFVHLGCHLLTAWRAAECEFRSSAVSHLAWAFFPLILLSPLNACCELNSHKLDFFQHSSSFVSTHHFPTGDEFAPRIGERASALPVYSVVWYMTLLFFFYLKTNWKASPLGMKMLALTLISISSEKVFLPPPYHPLLSKAGWVTRQGKSEGWCHKRDKIKYW